MLRRFVRNNPVSVSAGLLAVFIALVAVIVCWALPAGKPTASPSRIVASSSAGPKVLTARDFPLGNYQAGVLRNDTDPCQLVQLSDLMNALHQSNLGITQRLMPAIPKTDPFKSCVYGKNVFTIEVATEKPSSYAIFDNNASLFTGAYNPVNRIYAIDPEQLAPLGVRYGVWLMHDNTYLGTVFRTHTQVIDGIPTEANITFWCPGSLAKSSLDDLVRSAGASFGK